jgi:uncharacterized SAM-binding protein YcdF (DUF218 family)
VKPILISLLLPPGNLPLVAIVGLILLPWRPRLGAFVTWASCALLVLLAMPLTGGTMLVALEHGLRLDVPASVKPEAIVILSADIARYGGDDPGFGPGQLSLDRERAGAALFRRTQLPILITGGVLQAGEPPISVVMADSMRNDFAVPVRWTERESADTWENAEFSARILRDNGIHAVYLVTHAWHMKRALLAFHYFGVTAIPAPVQMDRYPKFTAFYMIPTVQGWMISYYAMHEWLGYAYYALRRSLG